MRVVSWNLANRVGDAVRRQAEFISGLDPLPTVLMLQEVNRRSVDVFCDTAGLDWYRLAADIRQRQSSDTPVRQRGVAIAGMGPEPRSAAVLSQVPLPERTIHALMKVADRDIRVASYHAPPGVSWKEKKPQQAVAFAQWLVSVEEPVVLGADANTPLVDHPDFALSRTHWHTGSRKLQGAAGDDQLWTANKLHSLRDALRRWLDLNPDTVAEIVAARPGGPLAVSHHTGKRRASAGTPRRFDSVWVSDHFEVTGVDYPYEKSIAAGSDHSAVVVDLELRDALGR